MAIETRRVLVVALGFVISVGCGGAERARDPERGALLKCLEDKNYAIRFLYWPPNTGTIPFPKIFRMVETSDPRYGDWSFVFPVGSTVYISPQEMRDLANGLLALNLVWKESPKPFSFEPELETGPHLPGQPYKLPQQSGKNMEILATCRGGSAMAELPPERICTDLAPLDKVFYTPRGLYLFQGLRRNSGCKVPGFDSSAIPPKRP